ncbi:MAG: Hsp70 family protein [Kofleriaceae bacterium]|nr:Hsp70 family protein [Kofleriaceae bacterium]
MDNRQLPLVVNYDIEEGRLPLSIKIALGEQLVEIIGAGTKVPVEKTVEISNAVDDQESLTIFVMQGLSSRREANAPVGKYVITGLDKAPAGTLSISLRILVTASLGIKISASAASGDEYPIELEDPGKPLGQKAITGLSEEADRDAPDEFDGVYDDVKFHQSALEQEEIPAEQAYVHTGMFVTWLYVNNLLSDSTSEQFKNELASLAERNLSGPQVYKSMGGQLSDTMLNEVGNAFCRFYFDFQIGKYLEDYAIVLAPERETMFGVEDNWENYDKLSEEIDLRFRDWQTKK